MPLGGFPQTKFTHEKDKYNKEGRKEDAYSNRVFANKINPRKVCTKQNKQSLAESLLFLKRRQAFVLVFSL